MFFRKKSRIRVVSPSARWKVSISAPAARTPAPTRTTKPPSKFFRVFKIIVWLLFAFVIGEVLLFFVLARRTWDEAKNKQIVIVSKDIDGQKSQVYFINFMLQQGKVKVIRLPEEEQVPVIGGYGTYPLRSIYPLLHLEKKSPEFIRAAYSMALQTVIDDVWVAPEVESGSSLDATRLPEQLLFFQIQSSLTVADRIWMYRYLKTLRGDKLQNSVLSKLDEWQHLQTGLQIVPNPEKCSLSIINTSGVAGIGTSVSRAAEGAGLLVIRLGEESQTQTAGQVLVDSGSDCSEVVDHVVNLFPQKVTPEKQSGVYQKYRAQVVLKIGQEEATSLKIK